MKIAFDIDGTLSDHKWFHRELQKFVDDGHDVIVWSGCGIPYAQSYVDRNNLPARVVRKCGEEVDVVFDDATDRLLNAKLTIQVWNKHLME